MAVGRREAMGLKALEKPASLHRVALEQNGDESIFDRPAWLWWALLTVIFAVGLGVRLYHLDDPPLDFHPTRQLHSALIARGMYYEQAGNISDGQRQMAVNQWRTEGVIEPQVFERLTAWTYGLLGRTDLRAPRLYAIFFWWVAAVFVVWLAVDLTGRGGALIAAFFFWIWPYGLIASRAFQPEPLMIACMTAAIWAAVRWERRGGWGWTIAAGLLAGLAIYLKSVAVFFVGPVLLVVAVAHGRGSLLRSLKDAQTWAAALLAALPYALYLVDGVLIQHYLVGQFSERFFPQMWVDPAFYLRWISNLGRAVPFEMILLAILSVFLVRRPVDRAFLFAAWVGYFLYGMTLSHHISTHDYYHLPLFPIIAWSLAAAGETLFRSLRGPAWLVRLVPAAVLVAAVVINGYNARTTLKRNGAAAQAEIWQTIGETVGAGASAAALVPDYGAGLEYYAWINPVIWPTADDQQFQETSGKSSAFDALFANIAAGRDYFVISPPDELDQQPALKQTLSTRYSVLKEGPGYLIYDLRTDRQP